MREKFAHNALSFILKYKTYEGKKLDKMRYGLEAFYTLFTKSFVILVFSIILGAIKETLLLIGFYGLLKTFGFGLHATKSSICWLVTIPTYIVLPLLMSIIQITFIVKIIIIIFAFVSFILFAPADTHKKPLINSKKRKIDKFIVLSLCLIYGIIAIFSTIQIIVNACLIALIIQAITVNPLIYMLFKSPYNNYKLYLKGV